MNSIMQNNVRNNAIEKIGEKFIQRFKLNRIMKSCGLVKKCGVSAYTVFTLILGLVFTRKNWYRLHDGEGCNIGFGKDAVYRMMSNPSINWESLLCKTAITVIPEIKYLTGDDRRCALIVDDTTLYRDRSKKVEYLSRCYDHNEQRYYNGFTVLAMGWSDGQTLIPVDMRVVASSDDKLLLEGSHVAQDGRTIATKRRVQARTDKPTLVLDMLKNVKGTPAECQYVLFDSWFASPKSLVNIKELGYDAVARLKKDNVRYNYNGQMMSVKQIFSANRKRRGKSKYLLSVCVTIERDGSQIPAKLVFVRNKNKRKDWIVLISTDISLTEEDIIALYGKRWGIETFFQVCKSNLRMEKEFQSRSFDAVAAHVAIVFIRYIMLSLESRENIDERSVCAIFHAICDELPDITLADALQLLLQLLDDQLRQFQNDTGFSFESFRKQFIASLPEFIRDRLVA